MKKITQLVLLLVTIFVAEHTVAQDVITLTDGTDVKAKIIEVTTSDVKYKKANNPDGPTYTLNRKDVLAIHYQDEAPETTEATVAQDVITLTDGSDVKAIIIEITASNVKYKKANNPDGPTYTLNKADILMIRYKNGATTVLSDNNSMTNTTTPYAAPQSSVTSVTIKNMSYPGGRIVMKGYANLWNFNWSKGYKYRLTGGVEIGIASKSLFCNPDFVMNGVSKLGIITRGVNYDPNGKQLRLYEAPLVYYYYPMYPFGVSHITHYKSTLRTLTLFLSPYEVNCTWRLNLPVLLNIHGGLYASVDLLGKAKTVIDDFEDSMSIYDIKYNTREKRMYNFFDLGIDLGGTIWFSSSESASLGLDISYKAGLISMFGNNPWLLTNTFSLGITVGLKNT